MTKAIKKTNHPDAQTPVRKGTYFHEKGIGGGVEGGRLDGIQPYERSAASFAPVQRKK
jgi:hypothetical protein